MEGKQGDDGGEVRGVMNLNPLEAIKKRMAIKWLCWEYGMSGVDAAACVERWPDHDKASEAVNVAEFVCDVCWGEVASRYGV